MKQNWERYKWHGKKKKQQWKCLQGKWDTRFKFFEAKTKDINSSSSDNKEEGAEYKVSEWCKCNAKAVVGRCSSK